MLGTRMRCIRPVRSDLLESQRVANILGIDVEHMLRIEATIAGRIFVDDTGKLYITETCSPDASLDMELREMRKILSKAIVSHLPPRQRLVVVGRFLEGRSLDDVARELDVSVEEIGRLQSRAMAKLREVPELKMLAGVS